MLAGRGVERWLLRDVDGAELPLFVEDPRAFPRVILARGASGLGMPTFAATRERWPGGAGAILRDLRAEERAFSLPWVVESRDRAEQWQWLRDLRRRVNPLHGPVTFVCIGPAGDRRELVATYQGGLEDDSGGADDQPEWQRYAVAFVADDPWYRAAAETVEEWSGAGQIHRPFFKLLPLRLSSSTVFATPRLTVGGDLTAWPVWTVRGPAVGITLRNLTTGERLFVDLTLAAGEWLRIDTNPRAPGITRDNGLRWFPQAGSTLWGLAPGTVDLEITLGGATAATSVTLAYRPLYLGP